MSFDCCREIGLSAGGLSSEYMQSYTYGQQLTPAQACTAKLNTKAKIELTNHNI